MADWVPRPECLFSTQGRRRGARPQLPSSRCAAGPQLSFLGHTFDVTRYGCKTEVIERPSIYEHVWIKFDGLDSLEAIVCWVEESSLGLMYKDPIHPAVFDMLLGWLKPTSCNGIQP